MWDGQRFCQLVVHIKTGGKRITAPLGTVIVGGGFDLPSYIAVFTADLPEAGWVARLLKGRGDEYSDAVDRQADQIGQQAFQSHVTPSFTCVTTRVPQ